MILRRLVRFSLLVLFCVASLPLFTVPAAACVGKTLVVGALDTPQQQVLAQMLSILISERTGTTVKIVPMESHAAAHEALQRADLDMYVEYTGVGQVELLKQPPIADPATLYQAVKERYNQDLNLVWLQPFGFAEPRNAPEGTVAEAAPVVRKDTLKKFPALARLINKLGGVIDLATMGKLETESQASSSRDVARRFLKDNRLI
ncbi:MAG: glycine betaine ABC transporter substrate-binding protein [Desulfuromonadales bacterium]|nr:glycine betaine ABC transporter substrate-binding protein [Desulfuromonadales bacterium]